MESSNLSESVPEKKLLNPEVLDRTFFTIPLFRLLEERPDDTYDVIIDQNLYYREGCATARKRNATDLKRDPCLQGSGLVDLLRAIQFV